MPAARTRSLLSASELVLSVLSVLSLATASGDRDQPDESEDE